MTLNLEELETLLAAATPGPWEILYSTKRGDGEEYLTVIDVNKDGIAWDEPYHEMFERKDTEAIVALRNAAPALIARVRELEAENDVLNEELSYLQAEAE